MNHTEETSLEKEVSEVIESWRALQAEIDQLKAAFTGPIPASLSDDYPKAPPLPGQRRRIWAALLMLFVVWFIVTRNPHLAEPLPAYPNGTPLSNSAKLPASLNYYYCPGGVESFEGERYQAFYTSDDEVTIRTYYLLNLFGNDAKKFDTTEYLANTYSTFCLSKETTRAGWFSVKQPAHTVMIVTPNMLESSELIHQLFPDAPTNKNVVLLIQGYNYNTLG